MPDFSKTIIYKIVHKTNPDDYDVYVGHSTNIQSRKWDHKKTCNNQNSKTYHLKVYQYIRENGGWDNFEIIEIEKYPCNDANEARQKEQEWCYKLNSNLNCNIPNRNKKQYYQDNRDKITEYDKNRPNKKERNEKNKQYRNNNREKINEKAKIYREGNREKINEKAKIYREDNREKINEKVKHYREDNPVKIKEQSKQYRINNRDKILERNKQKVTCDNCGSIVQKSKILRHKKTQKCINAKK